MKFTDSSVAKLIAGKAERADYVVWDDETPGFGLRIRAEGSRAYLIQYRVGGVEKRLSIGNAKKVTLEWARTEAKKSFGSVAHDIDPAIAKIKAAASAAVLFGNAADDFLQWQAGNIVKSYHEFSTLVLKVRFAPLHNVPLDQIDRRLVAEILKHIAENHGKVTANRHRAVARKFFRWAIGEGLTNQSNPVADTNKAVKEKARDRVLTNDEIAVIWRALGDDHHGLIAKLLLLTGQRKNEIGKLSWDEIDFDKRVITFASARTKNKNRHFVPLSNEALAILRSIERIDGRKFVFGRSGKNGFSGWSKCKERLDAKLGDIEHWTLHDFRRTFSTTGSGLKILPHIIEEILNHVKGGVKAVYNWAQYETERREAMDVWGKHIAGLVGEIVPPRLKLVA